MLINRVRQYLMSTSSPLSIIAHVWPKYSSNVDFLLLNRDCLHSCFNCPERPRHEEVWVQGETVSRAMLLLQGLSPANRNEDLHPTWLGGCLHPVLWGAVCAAMPEVQRSKCWSCIEDSTHNLKNSLSLCITVYICIPYLTIHDQCIF